MALLDELNPAQREAVATTEGPVLVLAGAGSGKTRVLTYRIAHILESGLATPDRILAVTFTNKAAGEMRERVEKLCGARRFPFLGTFHSICVRLLRAHAEAMGLARAFTIYDTTDQVNVIKDALKDLGVPEESFKPKKALAIISRAKNRLEDRRQFEAAARTPELETVARVWRFYEQALADNHALDFDDLLVRAVRLLQEHPDVLERYQEQFRYILVDEYQDVNFAQYVLIKRLAARHQNLCVVGDDDQSIYGFRGADVSIILQFEKDFPGARIVKLEQNYRSTQSVLDAANAVVRNNPGRRDKTMWTANQKGELPVVVDTPTGRAESRYVANRVKEMARAGHEYGDFAVLYRTNAQSRLFEEAFRHWRIPAELVGGTRFWDRKVVKDLVSYLRVVANPDDDLSLRRIINTPPRSIGTITLQRLLNAAERKQVGLYEILSHLDEVGDVTVKAEAAIKDLRNLVDELRQRQETMSVKDMLDRIIKHTGYKQYVAPDHSAESQTNLENVEELLNSTVEFERVSAENEEEPTLENFLAQGALASDVDQLKDAGGAVTMMTLHTAKGLEFPVVFLVGLEEDLFPHSRVRDNPSELEEERRLCYVGMTRAQKRLYITRAERRDVFGQESMRLPSTFLSEIPDEMVEKEHADDVRSDEELLASRRSFSSGYGSSSGAPSHGSSYGSPSRAPASARPGSNSSSSRSGPVKTIRPSSNVTPSLASAVGSGGSYVRREPSRPATPPPATFKTGQKVLHKVFGEGEVRKVDGRTVTAEFPGYGEKTVVETFLTAVKPPAEKG